ncbi:hypothetical protein WN55_00189 [Dufourea novaeangliae]|uniref:Uncharacterized protein n=1 Tax=Dufourea novaeangliae TaxID=178035 RepID=A0A154PCK5_DUFNO|nr:hypothetical protein WN55_00189 [Dufourea novaeangliae]
MLPVHTRIALEHSSHAILSTREQLAKLALTLRVHTMLMVLMLHIHTMLIVLMLHVHTRGNHG